MRGALAEYIKISIHALREEGDLNAHAERSGDGIFLSTPSARRATKLLHRAVKAIEFLSTPSARRATDFVGEHSGAGQFLSTPSARRAT